MKKTDLFNAVHDSLSLAGIHHVKDESTSHISLDHGSVSLGKNLVAVQCDQPQIFLPVIRHLADYLVSSQKSGMVRSFFYSKGLLIQLGARASTGLCYEKMNSADRLVLNQVLFDLKYSMTCDRDRALFLKLMKSKSVRIQNAGKKTRVKKLYS